MKASGQESKPFGPKRRLRLKLKLEADDLASLVLALHRCANELAVDGHTEGEVTGGDPSAGFQLKLTDRGADK